MVALNGFTTLCMFHFINSDFAFLIASSLFKKNNLMRLCQFFYRIQFYFQVIDNKFLALLGILSHVVL